jgi:hypothetical protein
MQRPTIENEPMDQYQSDKTPSKADESPEEEENTKELNRRNRRKKTVKNNEAAIDSPSEEEVIDYFAVIVTLHSVPEAP